jgi:monoterpene epsilon-lactone hydrolase
VLFLHGGAYIAGSLNTHRSMAAHIAQHCKLPVLLPEYRLAPEHPYPAAIEDAQAIYAWLIAAEGLPPQRLIVMGDSAGGGLGLALLLRLRQAGQGMPAALVCLSPWTDLQLTGDSLRTRLNKDPFFPDLQALQGCARLYGGEADLGNPEISPVRADLQGFPPLYVQVGDHEILLSDAQRVVQNAREAGVEARLEVWPGMWHVWQIAGPSLPEGRQALARIAAFVREVLS